VSSPNGLAVILGGGAVGSYVGGMLAAAGTKVVLLDGWPEHVEAIRSRGLTIASPEGEITSRPEAWHFADAYRLRGLQPTVAFLAAKLYDTAWSARLLAQWLPVDVPVATMQNALVEETVAQAVGWGRTLGVIAGGLDVSMSGPGAVRRSRQRGSGTTFKVGEMHGRSTPRAQALAELLEKVDHAKVTTDLWGERWAKLCANSMTTGLSGLTGLSLRDVYAREDTRTVAIRLGAEALAVGRALGFDTPALFGVPPDAWRQPGTQAMDALKQQSASMTADGMSGTLQDLRKGRPTEVEYFNGFIAAEGRRAGVKVAGHAAVAAMIREVERGQRPIDLNNLEQLKGN
jgi:2-dehydropantoate 2-reductase